MNISSVNMKPCRLQRNILWLVYKYLCSNFCLLDFRETNCLLGSHCRAYSPFLWDKCNHQWWKRMSERNHRVLWKLQKGMLSVDRVYAGEEQTFVF